MPIAIEFGVELLLVAAFLVAYGMLLAHRYTLSPILRALADLFERVRIPTGFFGSLHPLRFAARALEAVDRSLSHWLGQAVLATEKAVVVLWHSMAQAVVLLGRLIGDLAETIEHRLQTIITVTIPRHVRQLEHRLLSRIVRAQAAVARLEHAVAHDFGRAWRGIDALTRKIEHAIPREIQGVRSRVGRLERGASRTAGRVGKLERALGATGFATLVATAVGAAAWRLFRCNKFLRAGTRVCGMDDSLLETLLADSLLVLGALSLVELAEEMQGMVGESAGLIQRFWRAT